MKETTPVIICIIAHSRSTLENNQRKREKKIMKILKPNFFFIDNCNLLAIESLIYMFVLTLPLYINLSSRSEIAATDLEVPSDLSE